MDKCKVMYICHTKALGGAALSLYDLISSLKNYVEPIVLFPECGPAYDMFMSRGIRCLIVPFSLNIREKSTFLHYVKYVSHYVKSYFLDRKCIQIVLRHFEDEKDIRIVHSNSSVFTVGVGLSKALNAKHVWHIREFQSLDFGIQPFTGWKRLKGYLYSADAVISISKSVYKFWDLQKSNLSYCIFDAVCSKNDIVLNVSKCKYFVFCAENLCEEKGTSFAIKAFAMSELWRRGYKLIMIGSLDKAYYDVLQSIINLWGIKKYVDFIGYCDNVKSYMQNASAFLMCSRYEGLGRVTVEAMFYGCPVIARASGGTMDFIIDKKNGFLFSNLDSCVDVMKYVADNFNIDIVKEAQRFVVANFSKEIYGNKIKDVYDTVLSIK